MGFLMESMNVGFHWKTSLNVGALVTLVAAVHYFYMREYWVQVGSSPIVYRYIDWSITVPLQLIEFFLILSAVKPNIGAGMFWRLLIGTVVMLAFGYAGVSGQINAWTGFIVGMLGWGFILFEIFVYTACTLIGFCRMTAFSSLVNDDSLNLVYNLADFVNKIGFCLAIWSSAKQDTRERHGNKEPLLG